MLKWPINKSHLFFSSLVLIYASYFTYPCSIHAVMLAISSIRSPLSHLIIKDKKKVLPSLCHSHFYTFHVSVQKYIDLWILLVFVNERESGFWLCRYHLVIMTTVTGPIARRHPGFVPPDCQTWCALRTALSSCNCAQEPLLINRLRHVSRVV